MRIKSLLLAVILAAGWALIAPAFAYVLITDASGIYVVTWPPGSVPIQVKLSQAATLSDGNSQASSVLAAMQSWNSVLGTVQLAGTTAGGTYTLGNDINEIAMDSAVDGESFDSGVLAVTLSGRNGNTRAESDIIFNNHYVWDSYRGSLRTAEDIQRVALHELGHFLGLDHPDEHGQYVTAIMNSHESSTYTLQSDDISGVQKLYGAPGVSPANDNFANATAVTLTGSSAQLSGSNVAATREPGEPDHVGVAQGHSVWWKWTAPSSGSVSITTFGSIFDTVMSVYTGSAVNALTLVGENDDQESSSDYSGPTRKRTSLVTFNAVGGTTYYIAVDGWGDVSKGTIPYSGAITLNVNFGGAVPPVISSQPSNQTIYEGDTVSFSIYVSTGSGLTYRWQWLPNGTTTWVAITDGGTLSGSATSTLRISNVPVAGSGDQFRCVVTNSTGGTATSNAVLLTVNAKPLPTVYKPTYNISFNGAITAGVGTSGPGPFTYQWYHDGAAITGATSAGLSIPAAGGAEVGEYYVAVTNSTGTTLSPTAFLAGPTIDSGNSAPDYTWARAVEADGVIYFLFKSPARIARYDLNSETWLSVWPLAQAAVDLVVSADAIYVATGTNVARYDRNFGSQSSFTSTTDAIVGLLQADEYLIVVTKKYGDTTLTSYNRTSGQKAYSYPLDAQPRGLSYGTSTRRIYGGTTSSASIAVSVTVGTDGSFDLYSFRSSRQNYGLPAVVRTILLPDGVVADTGGTIYNGSDLTYAGSLGGILTDVVSDGAGGYYVLRNGRISSADSQYRETGVSVGHLSTPARFWRRNSTLYLFAQPTVSGGVPAVEKVAVGAIQPAALAPVIDPLAGRFEGSQWLIDEQGVVYIYSKLDRNIFRWSAQTKGFLTSLPLAGSPNFMAYSAETRALYFVENGSQIRHIDLDSGNTNPGPFASAPVTPTGLQAAGNLLWLATPHVQDSGSMAIILDGTGRWHETNQAWRDYSEYVWSQAKRRMYGVLYYGGLFYSEQIDATGAFVSSNQSGFFAADGGPLPVRLSPEAARVTIGSGQVMDGTNLALLGTLTNSYADAAWTSTGLYTIRNVRGATELQSWATDTWQLKGDRSFPGTPLRLLTLPDGKLLLGTLDAGKLVLRVIEPDTFAILSGPPVSTKTAQSITFGALADATYGDASIALGATASSGLPVSYNVVSGPATITGGTIAMTGAGTVVIQASQAGDATYEAAISVARSFTVKKPVLHVTAQDRTRTYGDFNPTLLLAYSGFIGRDTEAGLTSKPVAMCAALTTSAPGNYPITITGGVSANYDFAYNPGTLTVTKAPLTVKAPSIVQQGGTAIPAFTLTYTGFVLGQSKSVLTSQPVASTTATIDSPYGVYPITVTGGSADNYELSRVDGTLRIIPPSYNRTYFGTTASNGFWALQVRVDGTATYIAYLPGRSSAVVTELTVATDGSFSVTGAETKRTVKTSGVSALALAAPESPVVHTGAAAGDFTLAGQIAANGAVTGTLDGLGETFTGAVESTTGPAQALAGYYRAVALNTAIGATYVIVGASGQAVVVTTTPAAVDGAIGTVNASGTLTVTTSSGAALSVALDGPAQKITASLKPAGSSTPITYAGLAYGVAPDGRVVNLSVRTPAGTGSQTLIVGFVVTGSGSKPLLLRGIGPGLVSQGVPNALGDPTMRLLDASGSELAANNDWGGAAQLSQLFSSLGAFALSAGSKDAALSSQLTPGLYSCHVYPSITGTGVTLAEFYDADTATPTASVVNLSARTQVGTGGDILIAGFVITGNAPKTLLIRGLGPTLTTLGVAGALADPQLYLYKGPAIIANNDNWGGTTELKSAFALVGAGSLASDNSKDAALLVTLEPGVYSAQVSGVGGTTGVGLVEIFLMP